MQLTEIPRSPKREFGRSIFVNQAGYLPKNVKKAVINRKCESFRVVDENGDICFSGNVTEFGFDEISGDNVFTADLTGLEKEGRCRIITDSGDSSLDFEISRNAYDKPLDRILKAYYYLRCGCALEEKHAGKFTHGVCHDGMACLWEDNSVRLDVSGGWHDAGDYGRYVTAAACALAHLLNAYRLFPSVFDKRDLNIPESGGDMPDILAECRYELEWLLKMQRADGGVYHKVTTAHHAPFVMPEDDREQLYVFAVSSMATADFAAVCALASGIYRKYDGRFADRLMSAAEKSCDFLTENPQFIPFDNPEGCNTGCYGEHSDDDNRFWAYAEMYIASGDEKYYGLMKKAMEKDFPLTALGYGSVGGFGAMSLIFAGVKTDGISDKMKKLFTERAEQLAQVSDNCGYGAAMNKGDFFWGSNMQLMKHGMTFAIAHRLCGEKRFKDYAAAQLNCLFGVNALGFSFVTGVGEFSVNYPHLRPAFADGIEECIPGMVSGGANARPCDHDAVIAGFGEDTPPMKRFVDDVMCYSLNEITIYWNSPAVFTAAYVIDAFNLRQM